LKINNTKLDLVKMKDPVIQNAIKEIRREG